MDLPNSALPYDPDMNTGARNIQCLPVPGIGLRMRFLPTYLPRH
jgi:hypothetical protein